MNKARTNIRLLWLTIGTLLIALTGISGRNAYGQLPTGTIMGVVRDSSDALIPGANVVARNTDTGQTRTTVTGVQGSYRLPALPVGQYEVRVEHSGFQSALQSGLTLTVSLEAVLNFTLQVGRVEETVSVTAEAPLVNTTSGSLGGLVSEERVAELPLEGRSFMGLTLLQPGITQHRNA
ncbi:MAG: carboxypeptidase regulatory-like domain-containing protein, partial [Acidobacteria bacterium]|nr:carboxypeptidase regulatory-like domain-containing protein [Acidobacteriota bacterium]